MTDDPPIPSWQAYQPPVPGETAREARARRDANRTARLDWARYSEAKCASCGEVRFHVSHETDPEHSLEGPEYHRDFAHHAFEETP